MSWSRFNQTTSPSRYNIVGQKIIQEIPPQKVNFAIPAIPAGNLAFPYHRHLKFCSPRLAVQDNETKAGIFPGKVIIVEHGKLRALSLLLAWLVKRFIKVGARASYHSRRRYVHVASAFPLAHHYRALLAWGH